MSASQYLFPRRLIGVTLGLLCCLQLDARGQPADVPLDKLPRQANTAPSPASAMPRPGDAAPTLLAATHELSAHSGTIATPQMVGWLERMIRGNLPPTYDDDRKWGKQKEVWDGIKFRREGLKIETKRKKKLVNSGTWTRYSIKIVEPDELLHVQFRRLETLPDGKIAFSVIVDCALDVFGRLSQWVRDVQLISLSANADAACRLTIDGTVQFHLNPFKLPPDVGIMPHVDRAHIELTHYRVRRISQVGGDWAKHLGRGLRGVVDDKLADLNGKLVDKMNRQLDKHGDKLSFSTQDWIKSKLPLPEIAGE